MTAGSAAAATDVRLARAARAGDTRAVASLVARHDDRLRRICARILGNPHDADDAVQEAWLRALRAIRRITPGDVSAWLSVIARNEARRLASGRAPGAAPHAVELLRAPLADDPYEQARGRELGGELAGAMRSLTLAQRQVVLRDALGQSPAAAAAALGLTPGALRVRRHRARAALREALADPARNASGPARVPSSQRHTHPHEGAVRWPSPRTTSTSSPSRPPTRTSGPGRTSA